MGGIIIPCRTCGSTMDRNGACDCPSYLDTETGVEMVMEQCAFCNGYYSPGKWSAHRCVNRLTTTPVDGN